MDLPRSQCCSGGALPARRMGIVAIAAASLLLPACRRLSLAPWHLDTATAAADDASQAEAPATGTPSGPPNASPPPDGDDTARLLASTAWVRSAAPAEKVRLGEHRWRNDDVQRLVDRMSTEPFDLSQALAGSSPVVAANAAIVLGRLADPEAREPLAGAIDQIKLKVEHRCAAAEALAGIAGPETAEAIGALLDKIVEPHRRPPHMYLPALHAELLIGLVEFTPAASDARFVAGLKSTSPLVRVAALQAWARRGAGELPTAAANLASDNDPQVRIACLGALAACRHADAERQLERGLVDGDLNVRLAAIEALGVLGGPQAQAALEKLQSSRAEVVRAATIQALAALGADSALDGARKDKSYLVRQAAARSLANTRENAKAISAERVAAAQKLIDDASGEVQKQAVAALASWPLEQAVPLLIAAVDRGSYLARKAAAEQLAERWPSGGDFPVDGTLTMRAKAVATLRARCTQQFGAAAAASAAATGAAKPSREATPSAPLLAAIEQLADPRSTTRREAAQRIHTLCGESPLPGAAAERLAEVAIRETDPLVWQQVLAVIAEDDSEPAARLAYAAAGSPSPEVRRRACDHLAQHPSRRHAAVLAGLSDDPQETVALAAVRALGRTPGTAQHASLAGLLRSERPALRLEAAVALTHLGASEGLAALERMAADSDPDVRRRLATALGDSGERAAVPILAGLLEDRIDVQQAAQRSLTAIAGRDVAAVDGQSLSPTQKAAAWRAWAGNPLPPGEGRVRGIPSDDQSSVPLAPPVSVGHE